MKKILLFLIVVVPLLITFDFTIFLVNGQRQDISVTGSGFLENISERGIFFYERPDKNVSKYYGYIVELESEPLVVYKNRFEKTLKNLEESYNSLSDREKESLSGKILKAQIKAYRNTAKRRINAYKNFLKEEHESVEAVLLPRTGAKAKSTAAIGRKKTEEKVIEYEYFVVFNGFHANINEREARELEKHPLVKKVHKNYEVKALLMDSVPLIGADQVWQLTDDSGLNVTGEGITIAIIDTGVDYTYPDLGACTGEQFLAGECEKVIGGYDFVNNDPDPMDDHGHGTHCASIAAGNGTLKGVAPDAEILAYKVLTSNGFGTDAWVIAGIEAAVDPNGDGDTSDHADVISMSLGRTGNPDISISKVADNAVDAGAVMVVAAGNSWYYYTISCPGCARKVITVGATYKKDYEGIYWRQENPKVDDIAAFSSKGPVEWEGGIIHKPDIVAPGAIICAARYDEIELTQHNPYYTLCVDDKHIHMAGTSMATPMVAGAVALILQKHPDWNPQTVKAALKQTAKDLGQDVDTQGAGRIDILKAVNYESPIVAEIYPEMLSGTKDILGSAWAGNFDHYVVELCDYSECKEIWRSTVPVIKGPIVEQFNSVELNDGDYLLKLTVYTQNGRKDSTEATIKIRNAYLGRGVCELAWWEIFDIPKKALYFVKEDKIKLYGNAISKDFDHYEISWIDKYCVGEICGYFDEEGNWIPPKWNKEGVTLENNGKVPVLQGFLGTIDTTSMKRDWIYTIKLEVFNKDGGKTTSYKTVVVNPSVSGGWPKNVDISAGGFWVLALLGQPVISDIDMDDDDEALYSVSNKIFALEKDGSYVKGFPVEFPSNYLTQAGPAVDDIDNDGNPEIIAVFYDEKNARGVIEILNHEGIIEKKLTLESWYSPQLGIANFDSSSKKEIIVSWMGGIASIDYDSGQAIWKKENYKVPYFPFAIADLDKDGKTEIIFSDGEKIFVVDSQGNALPGWPQSIWPVADSEWILNEDVGWGDLLLLVGNIVGDEKDEILLVRPRVMKLGTLEILFPPNILVFNSDGEKIFEAFGENNGNVKVLRIYKPVLGDIDQDGKAEAIFSVDKIEEEGYAFCESYTLNTDQKMLTLQENPINCQNYGVIWDARISLSKNKTIIFTGDFIPTQHWNEINNYEPDYLIPYQCIITIIGGFDEKGQILEGFPKVITWDDGLHPRAHALGDFDGDNKLEYIFTSFYGDIYLFETEANKEKLEWPMPDHDPRHTNALSKPLKICSDGTPYGKCSAQKPLYCENGNLVSKCSLCGCDANYVCDFNTEQCIPSGISNFTLHLINNWNYISVPLENANLTLRKLKDECDVYHIFYYDPDKGYQPISYTDNPNYTLELGLGYAVRAYTNCDIVLHGTPWEFEPIELEANKTYLIGAPYEKVSVREILGTCALENLSIIYFDYSSGAENRINVTMLEPGKAYWVQSTEACTLGNSPTPCIPKTCEELGWECGTGIEPDCNTEIDCGSCEEEYICQEHECVLATCSDGTAYGKCSENKPYYCEEGNLIPKCSVCGCPDEKICDESTGFCRTKPDLTIEDLGVDPDNDEVSVTIVNLGETVARHFYVEFIMDKNIPKGTVWIEELPGLSKISNKERSNRIVIKQAFDHGTITGFHAVKVTVDYTNKIDETSENNNNVTKILDFGEETEECGDNKCNTKLVLLAKGKTKTIKFGRKIHTIRCLSIIPGKANLEIDGIEQEVKVRYDYNISGLPIYVSDIVTDWPEEGYSLVVLYIGSENYVSCPKDCSNVCLDSDNGINPVERGLVKKGIFGYIDICVSKNKVKENYCKENKRETKIIECRYLCKEGKCMDSVPFSK